MPSRWLLSLDGPVRSHILILEADNGDKPPIELEDFKVYYPATRVLFKANTDDEAYLYYGSPDCAPPNYDLKLVAGQLLAADQERATLAASRSCGFLPGRRAIKSPVRMA